MNSCMMIAESLRTTNIRSETVPTLSKPNSILKKLEDENNTGHAEVPLEPLVISAKSEIEI